MRGGGSSHVGSLRAANMENDERRAAFEAMPTEGLKRFFGSEQTLKRKDLRREQFSFVTWPLAETSIE